MALAKRDEGKKVNSNINVTPMVDVMLVLLIIFMVITPMLTNKVNVDLAKSENAAAMDDASKEDAITIAVTRDSKVYLGQNQTTLADLGSKVGDLLQNKTTKMVYFRADARAHYGTVMDAIDAVRTTGVDEVGLLTDQATQLNTAAPSGQ
ncbi:biopolymer transport protein ExbD/biopolymer transport protein TolR [Silvibacterium bohemicum]|uniref:Biopolymer transport protein ExbD/biopolymer transport protein TolR n=1 Tax=Silvibacterium bohemicum TaxID=1577686 RepID=A0A841K2S5_9BACT|nr:biopolymer transporter ExbD [Silvibacterium bohemicum]MBB6145461.1 biopolymer transport protein ExbD/biopolymer transport protein TolR [Silvibacterium bohemicum]